MTIETIGNEIEKIQQAGKERKFFKVEELRIDLICSFFRYIRDLNDVNDDKFLPIKAKMILDYSWKTSPLPSIDEIKENNK